MVTAIVFLSWAFGDPISGWWLLLTMFFDGAMADELTTITFKQGE